MRVDAVMVRAVSGTWPMVTCWPPRKVSGVRAPWNAREAVERLAEGLRSLERSQTLLGLDVVEARVFVALGENDELEAALGENFELTISPS